MTDVALLEPQLLKDKGDSLSKQLHLEPESIEAYQSALNLLSDMTSLSLAETKLKEECESAYSHALSKLLDLRTMPFDALTAVARSYNIPPLGTPTPTLEQLEAFRQTVLNHPKVKSGTPAPMRLLFIPESENDAVHHVEIANAKHFANDISKLLGCDFVDRVVLHSEDHAARAQGNPNGVGIGRTHTSYEAWMDDNAINVRPLNHRASALLCRPGTHGPILVSKHTAIKSTSEPLESLDEILCYEDLDEDELKSDRYKRLRAEWIHLTRGRGPVPGHTGVEVTVF